MNEVMEITEERRMIAYHEAGHAVVAHFLGHGFEYVSIVENKDSAGRVVYAPLSDQEIEWLEVAGYGAFGFTDVEPRTWIEESVIIYFAGPVAVHELLGETRDDGFGVLHLSEEESKDLSEMAGFEVNGLSMGGSDSASILSLLDRVSRSEEELGAYDSWLRERTLSILRMSVVRIAIEAVAGELLARERLTSAEVGDVIQDAIRADLDRRVSTGPSAMRPAQRKEISHV